MKAAILGFGREGKSVSRFLTRTLGIKRSGIQILDKKFHKDYLRNLERFDIVFRSPGVPWNLPELRRARKSGVIFGSATKLFFASCPATIIGVTGTKGKGTTATLIYKMLRAAGRDVHLVGNIGTSALDILPKLKKTSLVVFELSSFQLQDLTVSPRIAVILDIFPDHQDSHLNLKEYYGAKTSIARHQKKGDLVFYFKDSRTSRQAARKSGGRKIPVSEKNFTLFTEKDLRMRGAHNFKNAVMAASVTLRLGVPKRTVRRAATMFHGLEHRLEFVRTVRGTSFYNDSASTNPHTAAAAVRAFPNERIVLIAGGQDKRLNYRPLARALSSKGGSASGGHDSKTNLVVLFGENKRKIGRAIRTAEVPMKFAENLRAAVSSAYRAAKHIDIIRNSQHSHTFADWHSVVLFSPGAASFDMFRDYADRGEKFKRIVKALKAR